MYTLTKVNGFHVPYLHWEHRSGIGNEQDGYGDASFFSSSQQYRKTTIMTYNLLILYDLT